MTPPVPRHAGAGEMTIQLQLRLRISPGNTEFCPQTELSSRLPRRAVGPKRTRISCHAALDKAACAPFFKERRFLFWVLTHPLQPLRVLELFNRLLRRSFHRG